MWRFINQFLEATRYGMDRPATWKVILFVSMGVVALVTGGTNFSPQPDEESFRPIAAIIFSLAAAVCAVLVIAHLVEISRPNLLPDVLGERFGPHEIFQIGRCHLTLAAEGLTNGVRISGAVQNLNDGAGQLRLHVKSAKSVANEIPFVPDLRLIVPGGAVILFSGLFVLNRIGSGERCLSVKGEFDSSGKKVGFNRRRIFPVSTSAIFSATAMLASHVHPPGAFANGFYLSFSKSENGEDSIASDWQEEMVSPHVSVGERRC